MPQISYAPDAGLWLLSTAHTSYALRIDGSGAPCHVAWGARLTLDEAREIAARPQPVDREANSFEGRPPVGEELPVDGGARYGVPSLQVRFADGTRAVEWEHVGHETRGTTGGTEGEATDVANGESTGPANGETTGGTHGETPGGPAQLDLDFRDRHYPLGIGLHYRVHHDSDVIERWTTLHNTGDEAITLLRADSAAWTLPPREDYRLSHVTGQWAAETQLRREILPFGETVLTSRRGIPSHHANPWVMLDDGLATEDHGQVWSAALAWSGSWRITAQRTSDGRAGFAGGAGHDSTTLRLGPGETHTTPRFAGLRTEGGFGAASRAWHAYTLAHVLPHPDEIRPVLYNSWEATGFDIDEQRQMALAARAAELGAELYVMDDGWFGARRSDRAGLGDWTPSPDRFPMGLAPLAEEVHRLGMRFGIWVEPEMVNADSDLYRAHPDWILHFPHRTRTELRNQLVLNFARDDVADWAYGWLTALVADNGVDFLKWDMNRPFSEAGPAGGADGDDRLWTTYVHNLYGVIDRLRADHPRLRIEACSGGGGRVDLGMLSRTDQAWPSDNTDAADRIGIQHGYSQIYPPSSMATWVTDVPNQLTSRCVPLAFRFHVAMAGSLAIGGDLTRWPDEEIADAAGFVRAYKQVRHLVQHGVQYRLRAPVDDGPTAVQYLAPDRGEALVLAWQRAPRRGRPELPVHLAGLDPAAVYRDVATGVAHYATVLMEHGLPLELPAGDWASTAIHLRRVTP